MVHLTVLLSLGCLASGSVINPLDVNDFHRSRPQGLNHGEELQINLELHPNAEIHLRGGDWLHSYNNSVLLLNLTISRDEGATLAIGNISKSEALRIHKKAEVKLSRRYGDKFRIIIDGKTFYDGSADFANSIRYVHVHGDALVTGFNTQEATRLAVINNVAKIDLDVGDTLILGFNITYPDVALLDNRDKQNLCLFTYKEGHIDLYKNTGKAFTDKQSFGYQPQPDSIIIRISNNRDGLLIFANGGAGYLWKHDYNAASTAYRRLYIKPEYLPHFQNSSITRKPKQ